MKSREEIEALEKEHDEAPHLRLLQKSLAEDITSRVHSKEELDKAIHASKILFGKKATDEINNIDEETLLSVFDGIPKIEIEKEIFEAVTNPIDLLSDITNSEIFSSKGEARRMIQGGGVSINKVKIQKLDVLPEINKLQGKYVLVQKGRKNYYLIKVK